MAKKLKFQQVYDAVLRLLRNGVYQVGDRLPSERELSEKLGVNIATVRRGYRELTLAGIVEKRIGSGAYMRQPLESSCDEKPVTILFHSQTWNFTDQFLKLIPSVMAAHHRSYRLVVQDSANFQELLASNIQYEMPTIFLDGLDDEYLKMVKKAPHIFVVMSRRADKQGIPSVLCEDTLGIQQLVAHLKERGCQRIAMLCLGRKEEMQQISAWRQCVERRHAIELLIPLQAKTTTCEELTEPMDTARETILAEYQARKFDGLIALNDEIAMGALAGLANAGIRIPQEVAIAAVGNTRFSRSTVPPLTVYDPDLRGHLEAALTLLDDNMAHPDTPKLLHFIPPILHIGGSTERLEPDRKMLS